MREVLVESVGDLTLRLGGEIECERVRGGQGPVKNKFLGFAVVKKDSIASVQTAQEAALALGEFEQVLARWSCQGGKERCMGPACARSSPPRSTGPPFP